MTENIREARFPSSDGVNSIHSEIFMPEKEPLCIIQIVHGMVDHIERYRGFAEAMCAYGYIVAGCDHLGHGKTVKSSDDFGFFASKMGHSLVIEDTYRMNRRLKEEFPSLPIVMLGHSMGSFIARLYAEKHPDTIDALIIHGTSGPNPALPFGKVIIKILKAIKGERHRSKFVRSLAEGGYNRAFDASEGEGAWLTRDGKMVADRPFDARTNFTFTLSGYGDLFEMLTLCNKKAWYEGFDKELPTLVVSGDRDPVGNFGKGVRYVYDNLKKYGAKAELKLYEGARHELFNETCREEVFSDLHEYIGKALQ